MKAMFKVLLALLVLTAIKAENLRFLEPSSKIIDGIANFDNILQCFNKVMDTWPKMVSTFKTTVKTESVENIVKKGFSYFKGSCATQVTKGIRENSFEKFSASVIRRLQVPVERQNDVADVLNDVTYSDSSVWTSFNMVFNNKVKDNDNVKYATILMTRNDEKNTYDAIIMDLNNDFKLAKDVLVVNKKVSVLGGIWSSDVNVRKEVPKDLGEEELKEILTFFQIVSMKALTEMFGFKLDFPDI